MADGFHFDWREFDERVVRRIATSARPAMAVLIEQARGILREVARITPRALPAVIAADVRKVYGNELAAHALMRERDESRADQFLALFKKRELPAAAALFQEVTGESIQPFDGGTAHRKARNRRGNVRVRKPRLYTFDEDSLKAYIKEKQGHREWLTSGWGGTARRIGGSFPASVFRHTSAPGVAEIVITNDRLSVKATNAVGYASNTDLPRRIQWAINRQSEKMENQWQAFVERRFK